MATKNRKIAAALGGIFILALLFRGIILAKTHDDYYFTGLSVESGIMAINFARGDGFAYNTGTNSRDEQTEEQRLIDPIEFKDELIPENNYFSAHEVPGYAVLLAATWKLFGAERYIYLQTIQIILDALLVFLIFWIVQRLIPGKRGMYIGLLAAFFLAFFYPQARIAASATRDIWPLIIIMSTIALLLKAKDFGTLKKRSLLYLGIGVMFGLGMYLHPIIQYLNFFLALALITHLGWKDAAAFFIITTVCIGLILTPWIVRNFKHFDRFIPTRDTVWQGIWEGWGEFPDNPMGAILDDGLTYQHVLEEGYDVVYGSPEYNDILKQKSLAAIKKYPLWVAGATIRRIPHVLKPGFGYTYPEAFLADYQALQQTHGPLAFKFELARRHPDIAAKALLYRLYLLFLISVPVGIFLFRKKWREIILLTAVPIYFFAVLIPLHVEPRYLISIFPIYCIFSGIAIYYAGEKGFYFISRRT
ncbi:hypothetical protein COV82_06205 [Candidatus Peregrinibacteria bacterium CG11_big_fil_rev_8_21_14_0_20_46_8]|nr:MAG: hypothetical protein COV82_06205 [Candidatus Peregrinibacteria bacterium CG11_big_fil_rev_8_21_14_0_20_46_8]